MGNSMGNKTTLSRKHSKNAAGSNIVVRKRATQWRLPFAWTGKNKKKEHPKPVEENAKRESIKKGADSVPLKDTPVVKEDIVEVPKASEPIKVIVDEVAPTVEATVDVPVDAPVDPVPAEEMEAALPADEAGADVHPPIFSRESSKRGKLVPGGSQKIVVSGEPESEVPSSSPEPDSSQAEPAQEPTSVQPEIAVDKNIPLDAQVAEAVQGILEHSQPFENPQRMRAVIKLRKLLSIERNPPIQPVVDSGISELLVDMITNETASKELVFELAWILTNIASGSSAHTAYVVNCGTVRVMTKLLSHPDQDVVEQAVWCLGNISGDCAQMRDIVAAEEGLAEALIRAMEDPSSKISLKRNATWAISNMCRGKPSPPLAEVRMYPPAFQRMLANGYKNVDPEVLTDLAWALSYISDGPNERIQCVIDCGVVPTLVQILDDTSVSQTVRTPVLRTIGNIVTGDDLQTNSVVQSSGLQVLARILKGRSQLKPAFVKEACWTVSNICAGTPAQVHAVIDEAELISSVVDLIAEQQRTRVDVPLLKEAAFVLANAAGPVDEEHILRLVDLHILEGLTVSLQYHQQVAWEGIELVFTKANLSTIIKKVRSRDVRDKFAISESPILTTSLHRFPVRKHVGYVTTLMAMGYRPDIEDATGETALQYAKYASPPCFERMQQIQVLLHFTAVSQIPRLKQGRLWLPIELWHVLKEFLFTIPTQDELDEVPDDDEVALLQNGSQQGGHVGITDMADADENGDESPEEASEEDDDNGDGEESEADDDNGEVDE